MVDFKFDGSIIKIIMWQYLFLVLIKMFSTSRWTTTNFPVVLKMRRNIFLLEDFPEWKFFFVYPSFRHSIDAFDGAHQVKNFNATMLFVKRKIMIKENRVFVSRLQACACSENPLRKRSKEYCVKVCRDGKLNNVIISTHTYK